MAANEIFTSLDIDDATLSLSEMTDASVKKVFVPAITK